MWSILGVFGGKKDEKDGTATAPPIMTEVHTITPSAEPQPVVQKEAAETAPQAVVQKESATTAPIAEQRPDALTSNSPLVEHNKPAGHICGPECYAQSTSVLAQIITPTQFTNVELAQAVYVGFEGAPEERANLLVHVRDLEKLKHEYRGAIALYTGALERYKRHEDAELDRAKQIRELQAQLRDVKQKAGRNVSLENQVLQLQDANKTLRKKADSLKDEQDTLKMRQAEHAGEYHRLEQRLKTAQEEAAKSQKSLAEAGEELAKAQARVDEFTKKAEEAWKTAEEIDAEFSDVQKAITPLKTELETAKDRASQLETANKDLTERLKRRDAYSAGLEVQLDDERKKNQQMLGVKDDAQKAIDAEIQAREQLRAEKQELEQVIKDARTAIEKYESNESPSETVLRLLGNKWTGADVRNAVNKVNQKVEQVITENYTLIFPQGMTEAHVIGLYSEQEYVFNDLGKKSLDRLGLQETDAVQMLKRLENEKADQVRLMEIYGYARERAVSKRDLESLDTLFLKEDEEEESKEDAVIEEIDRVTDLAKARVEEVERLREHIQKRREEYKTGIRPSGRIDKQVPAAVYYTVSPAAHQVKVVFPWNDGLNANSVFKELAAIVARSLHERGASRNLKIEKNAIEFTSSYPAERYEEKHVVNSVKKIAEQIEQITRESPLGRLGLEINVAYLGRGNE